MKKIGAAFLLIYLLLRPAQAIAAALSAIGLWASRVAPALFPFLAILPALSGPADGRSARGAKGFSALFGISGRGFGAAAMGLLAGSPAGAIAVRRAYGGKTADRAEVFRCLMLSSGCGPVFLMCSVGAGMLSDPGAGWKLIASQLLALLTSALILARLPLPKGQTEAAPASAASDNGPIREGVLGTLTIGGWMALFAVINAMLEDALPGEHAVYVLELASGCTRAALRAAPLPAIGAICGFGGLCVAFQNLSVMRGFGIRPAAYLAAKILSGALCAAYCLLFENLPAAIPGRSGAFAPAAALALALTAAVTAARLHRRIGT